MPHALSRDAYLPAADHKARPVTDPAAPGCIAYVWEEARDGRVVPMAKGFAGKGARPVFFHRYGSPAQRDAHVAGWLASHVSTAKAKAARKAEVAAARAQLDTRADLPIGAIVVSSWGYDQTNVDAYEVVAHRGRVGVDIRAIGLEITSRLDHHAMAEHVKPVRGAFLTDAPVLRCIQRRAGHLTVDGRQATKWDGVRAFYQSHYA